MASEGKNQDPLLKMEDSPLAVTLASDRNIQPSTSHIESAQNSYKTPRKNAGCFFLRWKEMEHLFEGISGHPFFPAHPCADVF